MSFVLWPVLPSEEAQFNNSSCYTYTPDGSWVRVRISEPAFHYSSFVSPNKWLSQSELVSLLIWWQVNLAISIFFPINHRHFLQVTLVSFFMTFTFYNIVICGKKDINLNIAISCCHNKFFNINWWYYYGYENKKKVFIQFLTFPCPLQILIHYHIIILLVP